MSCVLIDARTGAARSETRTTRPLLTPQAPHLQAASPPPVCLLCSARTVRSSSACAPHRGISQPQVRPFLQLFSLGAIITQSGAFFFWRKKNWRKSTEECGLRNARGTCEDVTMTRLIFCRMNRDVMEGKATDWFFCAASKYVIVYWPNSGFCRWL